MKFRVPGMSCGHCTAAISKSIKAKDSSALVETDLKTKTVTVETAATAEDVRASIEAAGYEASPV